MEKVLDFIRKNRMINTGEKIVVGVSGGPDSVCLLFLLKKYQDILGISLFVVHMEHGIRGKESEKDALFVENLCREWEIPCNVYHRDVPTLAKKWKCSEEEAGRRVRYEAFEEVREKIGAEKIAVAHNQDDQAETVLFNLARGSGLTGLAGMRPVRGRIIRPLLCLSRREIEEILEKEGIPCRIDATNRETDYARNRIRLHILPLLREELNPKASVHMAETARRLSAVEDYLTGQAADETEKLAHKKNGILYLDREALLEEPEILKEYILRRCVFSYQGLRDISSVHIEALKVLAVNQSGRSLCLPGGLFVRTEGKYLLFGRENGRQSLCPGGDTKLFPLTLPVPGQVRYGKYRVLTAVFPYKNEIIPEKMYTKWFDYDTIKNTVQLRSRRSGDFLTVTADGGQKTLKRYLIDEKVPAGERNQLCLLADGSHILWVVGYRISEAYKVTEKTKQVLEVQVMEE